MRRDTFVLSDGVRHLEVLPLGEGRWQIVRYTSPYVEEYLNAALAPGVVLVVEPRLAAVERLDGLREIGLS